MEGSCKTSGRSREEEYDDRRQWVSWGHTLQILCWERTHREDVLVWLKHIELAWWGGRMVTDARGRTFKFDTHLTPRAITLATWESDKLQYLTYFTLGTPSVFLSSSLHSNISPSIPLDDILRRNS